ncbi:CheR family methyltransferase [Castellaniella sp.]|uniref:CheR family methyltransferase n=1 Tax=Castellaniella sp. TaxID=1955812 RepID=UPI0035675995
MSADTADLFPSQQAAWAQTRLEAGQVERAQRLLRRHCGMVLGTHKRMMAERVLRERVDLTGAYDVTAYLNSLEQDAAHPEWEHFVNAFMINHTAFFREDYHFPILAEFVQDRPRPVHIWCAAASTGEEPYSIAMTLQSVCANAFSVWATDIDTEALAQARDAVYPLERVQSVPAHLLRSHFQRGLGVQQGFARVRPELAATVTFQSFNLASAHWQVGQRFDAIFCRNTMIYFDRALQEKILRRFVHWLKPDGLIFVGHSESYTDLRDCVRLRGKAVYTRAG